MMFMAVQCYSCFLMQVKQVKKSCNNWCCSVCNEKQSVRKVYFTSDAAKDVRVFVQKFNLTRGLAVEAEAVSNLHCAAGKLQHTSAVSCAQEDQNSVRQERAEKLSTWQQFLPDEDQDCAEVWDLLQQTSEKFSTCLPDSLPKERENFDSRPKKSSGRSQTVMHGGRSSLADYADDFLSVNTFAGDSTFDLSHRQSSFKLKRGRDDGSQDGSSVHQIWGPSQASEFLPFVTEDALADCSPKKFKSGHVAPHEQHILSSPTQTPQAHRSKWSKYLE